MNFLYSCSVKRSFDRLKNLVVNFIYRLYTSIADVLLQKYFVEFTFLTSNKVDKCYLPLILYVKSKEEAELLVIELSNQMIKKYDCSFISITPLEHFGTDEMLKQKIKNSELSFKAYKLGKLEIDSLTPKPGFKVNEFPETELDNIGKDYEVRREFFSFRMMKINKKAIEQHLEYIVEFQKWNGPQ